MDNQIRSTLFLLLALLFTITCLSCKKGDRDLFCSTARAIHANITNKDGTIVYSNKYKRYAVRFLSNTPGNIDAQQICLVCNIGQNFQVIGMNVVVSGTLKKFNSEENITPEIGGQELYFLEINKIAQK